MKMTIARALKERKRLIGEMNKVHDQIARYNVVEIDHRTRGDGSYVPFTQAEFDARRAADPRKLLEYWYELRRKLAAIKLAIQKANNGIAEKLIMLSEYKAELTYLEGMRTGTAGEYPIGDNFIHGASVVFDAKWVTEQADLLRKVINDTQDAIDEYNASHYVEIAD